MPAPPPLTLRLYIAGDTPNSALAMSNLREMLEDQAYELEVVDVLTSPERALNDGVFVTPTLLRLTPAPQLRFVGSLTPPRSVARKLMPPPVTESEAPHASV